MITVADSDTERFVERAKSRDSEAYGELVTRYGGLVHGVCLSMVNAGDAEDLAHDAFVEAWIKLPTLRRDELFGPWLRTVTVNVCRMWHRKRHRELEALDDVRHEIDDPLDDGEERLDALFGGLSRLSSHHQLALALRYWEGLSYEEIAAFLGVASGTVMSRLHRARSALKEKVKTMSAEDYEPPTSRGEPHAYESLRRAVEAEISVLVELWGKEARSSDTRYLDSGIKSRLTVLLARRPDQLRPVFLAMDEVLSGHLAIFLKHMCTPAIDVTVACALDDEDLLRQRARLVLRDLIGKASDRPHADKFFHFPVRGEATLILDALIRGNYDDARKAELVVDLITGSEDEASEILLGSALLCWSQQAFPLLWERWWAEGDSPGPATPTLGALARTGTPFLNALGNELDASNPARALKSLAGAEALADITKSDWQPNQDTALGKRVYGWVPHFELDQEALRALGERAAQLLHHPSIEVCGAVVRFLGVSGQSHYLPQIRQGLRHANSSVRKEAVIAVSMLGDADSVAQLMEIADKDELPNRIAALQALGHLRAQPARDLLVKLTEDSAVRLQAVSALGGVDDDIARTALEKLMQGPDKKVARMAANALYGGSKTPRATSESTRERLRRVRGAEARPWLDVSIAAAIRNLPELRPYPERELTRYIGEVCSDYSTTRRELVMGTSYMVRNNNIYELTELGSAIWRVEKYLGDHFQKSLLLNGAEVDVRI